MLSDGENHMPRPPDLPSAKQLAKTKRHGHKMRYMAGCRCWRCRAGNAAYERKLNENSRLYGPNDLVPTDRVRQHLKYLQQFGIGHKTAAKHASVGKTVLAEVLWYGRKQMRRRNEARVLAVRPTLGVLPKNVNVPAADTVAKIRQLVRWGYPKSLINRDGLKLETVGMQVHALRGKTGTVTAKTAVKIRDFFAKIEGIRQVWLSRCGPIPRGYFVYWKTAKHGHRLRQLELRPVSRAYNYHYIYPPDLKSAITLANRLKRVYRSRRKDEKHNGRSEESPVRHN
jgi:hypothetical protein